MSNSPHCGWREWEGISMEVNGMDGWMEKGVKGIVFVISL